MTTVSGPPIADAASTAYTPLSFTSATSVNTLDKVRDQLAAQANSANEEVSKAIAALNSAPDNPALLANLQHIINKWSVVYNINSTVTRSMRDLMAAILQKIS